jgi:O-antigen ligase
MGVLLMLGFVTNFSTTTLSQLQAYLLALGCYVFVRENSPSLSSGFLTSLLTYFLLINGSLVILQFVTGDFYPARYLAAGDPELRIASGVSDGPTKNGMLIAFAASFLLGSIIWGKRRASNLELAAFLIGIVSLALSASRAGLLSFGVVALVGLLLAVCNGRRWRVNGWNAALLVTVLAAPILFLFVVGLLDFETLLALREADEEYGGHVVIHKLTTGNDGSVAERFENWASAARLVASSPLQILSTGFGAGSFEVVNANFAADANVHNSYIEVLVEQGIYGFVLFILLVFHIIRKALSRHTATALLPAFLALLSVMVFMAFHDVLRGRIFWIPLALLAASAYSTKERSNLSSEDARLSSQPASA